MERKRPALFDRLKTALDEGIAYERNGGVLRETEFVLPDPPRDFTADDIREIRTRLRLSQAGLARLMHVSHKTVQSWEQGTRHPQSSAARLLQFIEQPETLTQLFPPS